MKQEIKERIEKIRKGEVPEGYRKTKVGIIPVDWEIKTVKYFTDVTSGGTPSTKVKEYWGGNIRWMNSGELNLKRVLEVEGRITETGLNNSATKLIPENCVLVGLAGQGKTRGTIAMNMVPLCTNQSIAAILPCEEVSSDYLYHNLDLRYKELRSISTGDGGRGGLNLTLIKNLPIPLPPTRAEQTAIATVLSDTDALIRQLEKLITEKKEFKRGLMQKLLFQRGTSNILWNEIRLTKCLIPTSYPVNKPSEPYYTLGIRSHCKGTMVKHIDDPKKIAMDTLYEVKENELIVNITFAWEGAITILSKKDEGKLVSHRFPTYKFNEEYAIPDYFKQLIKTKWFVFQLGQLSPGGAGRNRVLSKTDFLKLKVLLPPVKEQGKIADFLNYVDDEIDLLNKELNQFKEQKRGLKQLLLTGIVRVEVD